MSKAQPWGRVAIGGAMVAVCALACDSVLDIEEPKPFAEAGAAGEGGNLSANAGAAGEGGNLSANAGNSSGGKAGGGDSNRSMAGEGGDPNTIVGGGLRKLRALFELRQARFNANTLESRRKAGADELQQ